MFHPLRHICHEKVPPLEQIDFPYRRIHDQNEITGSTGRNNWKHRNLRRLRARDAVPVGLKAAGNDNAVTGLSLGEKG
jgi:hypothetical protein